MGAARRHHQQRLGGGVPAAGLAFHEEAPDLLGAGRSAGFARRQRGDPGAAERRDEEPDLRRLAGAFAAFDGDETAAVAQCFFPSST
jgi:hypothetical protein